MRWILFAMFCCVHSMGFSQTSPGRYFLSNTGNDANSGTSDKFPLQSFGGNLNLFRQMGLTQGKTNLLLKGGDLFKEAFYPTHPVTISTFQSDPAQNNLAIMYGSEPFTTGWTKLPDSNHTYYQLIPFTGYAGLGINDLGRYSFIYPIEINKAAESRAPYTSRKPMILAPSLAACDSIPGSFFEEIEYPTVNPKMVYLHPSDQLDPNNHPLYRYELSTKDRAVNASKLAGNRFENLWVTGYGAGHGMLPGGDQSYYNNIIFGPGAGIHHLVTANGSIHHSLFLRSSKNTSEFAIVFYDPDGLKRRNLVENSMFLDIEKPIYSHTSFGDNYQMIEINRVVSHASLEEAGYFAAANNADSLTMNEVFTDQHFTVYWNIAPRYFSIANSCFRNATRAFYLEDQSIKGNLTNTYLQTQMDGFNYAFRMGNQTSLDIKNCIFHLKNKPTNLTSGYNGTVFIRNAQSTNQLQLSGNIFIGDGNNNQSYVINNSNSAAINSADRWNNNVYILLKGNSILWAVPNPASNNGNQYAATLAQWQQQSGQDANSLFFDLRNDPRGLKAIFQDPDKGDFALAFTDEANQIRQLQAGMTDPLGCFLTKPTYEEAAAMIKNNVPFRINECRNPCLGRVVRLQGISLQDSLLSNQQIQLRFQVAEQQNIRHYEIQRGTGVPVYSTIARIPVNSQGQYQLVDANIASNTVYRYRLAVVNTSGQTCYAPVTTVTSKDDGRSLVLFPNPTMDGKVQVWLNGYLGKVAVQLRSSTAQLLETQEQEVPYGKNLQLNFSRYPAGLYWLTLQTSNGTTTQKLLIQ